MSYLLHKYGKPLGSKDNVSQKRRIKNQDSIKSCARVINIPTLSESPVLNEFIVPKKAQVIEETVTPKKVFIQRKYEIVMK